MVIIKYFMQDTSLLGFLIVCITNGHRHIRICFTQYPKPRCAKNVFSFFFVYFLIKMLIFLLIFELVVSGVAFRNHSCGRGMGNGRKGG